MSGLDQSSSVDYTTLVELDSQNERDSRVLKHDAEATLNNQYNQWLSGNGNSGTSQLSRTDKLRQANEKLAFNFAVGGQGRIFKSRRVTGTLCSAITFSRFWIPT